MPKKELTPPVAGREPKELQCHTKNGNTPSGEPIKKVTVVFHPPQNPQSQGLDAVRALRAAGKVVISESDVYQMLKGNRYRRSLSLSALREFCRVYSGFRLVLRSGEWCLIPVGVVSV